MFWAANRCTNFGCTLSDKSRAKRRICKMDLLLCVDLVIAQALASSYKQSLYFAFRLSRQHYSEAGMRRSAVLEPLLADSALERFAQELHALTLPQQRWQGWQNALETLIIAHDLARPSSSSSGVCFLHQHACNVLTWICAEPVQTALVAKPTHPWEMLHWCT